MAYASWSVVFGEQPSAAKWNILGTNDASFNDGTGIGTNAVAAASLATSALYLGQGSKTTDTSGVTTTSDICNTGSIVIPTTGRMVQLQAFVSEVSNTGSANMWITITDAVGAGGTEYALEFKKNRTAGDVTGSFMLLSRPQVITGTKTFYLSGSVSGGTGTFSATATRPAWIAAVLL
mgnify:CR=1 FL=1